MRHIKTRFSVQIHWQKRVKKSHFDLRIVAPSGMTTWSWAFPKQKFPVSNERILAIKTANHKISYMYYHGTLKNGDVVSVYDRGTCVILKISKDLYVFRFSGKHINGTFVFIKIQNSEDSWIVLRSKKSDNEFETKT